MTGCKVKTVTIRHCKIWPRYKVRAVRLAERLRYEFGVPVKLVEGNLGEFNVLVNNNSIAKKTVIFPPAERKVLSAVRRALEV